MSSITSESKNGIGKVASEIKFQTKEMSSFLTANARKSPTLLLQILPARLL